MTLRFRPLGIKLLVAFFVFGAAMCTLTIVLLLFPGTQLDLLWRANPEAHRAFSWMGASAVVLMFCIGAACTAAAIGVARGAAWGLWTAVTILAINVASDAVAAGVRHDLMPVIGVPIGSAMIIYLLSRRGR